AVDHAAEFGGRGCGCRLRTELRARGVPVHTVERRVEVGVADDRPDRVERFEPLRNVGRWRRDRTGQQERCGEGAEHHLTSALISAGSSNTAGSTLSYSIEVNVITICAPLAVCLMTVGCRRSPNFL